METLVTVIYVLVCLFLILVVLLQAGRGAGMGIFGGAGQTVFGGRGATSFLGKLTALAAVLFVSGATYLAWASSQQEDRVLRARAAEIARQKQERQAAQLKKIATAKSKASPAPATLPVAPLQPDGGLSGSPEADAAAPAP
ncbi:MAG: preprotein translocase subunit SecG [Proteobacteria bacterium]|nr:preprotein translocase subunit SecG [Pseudomonadota bacterium]